LLLALGLPIAALWFGQPWWVAILSIVPGAVLYRAAPIRLPRRVQSFGDLIKIVTAHSMGRLAMDGARLGEREAWTALRDIAADHAALQNQEITPDTLILAPKKAA
jgi:hypothetical protein